MSRLVLGSSAAVGFSTVNAALTSCAANLQERSAGPESQPPGAIAAQSDPNAESDPAGNGDAEPNSRGIKVGLLHSLSGTMALSETPLVDAELMAIEEINAAGGVLGQPLIPVKEDGSSDWPTFAEKAEKLIDQSDVAVIFGGLTSASRKAILPVVKAKDRLLWYPGAYEGQECSQHIFYAGATANQQIEPAVNWMLGNRGKSFFLVSSNARMIHAMVKAQLKAQGGKVAGEAFVPLTNSIQVDMEPVVKDIQKALPNGGIIFNSLVGNHNRAFFRDLKRLGLLANKYLVMSVRVSEEEVFQIGPELLAGHYATWNYFQSIDSPDNQAWVSQFKDRYGSDRVLGDAMEAAYVMVHLWAQSVEAANSTETAAVRRAAYGQTFDAPQGKVAVQLNHHLTKRVRIGQVLDDGQFEILVTKEPAIAPNPWTQYLPSGQGYACNWSDPDQRGKYRRKEADKEAAGIQ